MKKFRVLNIIDTSMEVTNQRVAVIELAEIKYQGFTLPSGLQPYSFGSSGEDFVIDFNSHLTQSIIQSANNDEIVEFDLSDFTSRYENKNGRNQKIYYHKNVKLLDCKNIKTSMFKFCAEKIDGEIYVELEGNFSIAQIDIALKDICIYLRSQSSMKNKYLSDSDGYIKVSVDKYERKLSEHDQMLINMRILPINQVTIEHDGFSFEEIQELLENIQNQLPEDVKASFMYSVDFKKLLVD